MKPDLILLTNTRGSVWQRSIGAYQVAHHCRQHGFTVQVIDFTDFFSEEELIDVVSNLSSNNLLAVGLSTTFYSKQDDTNPLLAKNAGSNLRGSADIDGKISNLFKHVKQHFPTVKIIAGGANSWQLENNKLFDAVFHGYAEESVASYLKSIQTKQRTRIHLKKNGIDIINGDLETFDIELLEHRWLPEDIVLHNETLPIEIGRGCIFKCKFCSYPLNGKQKLDYIRDYSKIVEEMEYNYAMFGTTNYFFTDDTFNDSTEKIESLHKVFTSLSFKINFVCYLRADLMYRFPKQIQLLKEMGLSSVVLGIESLHQGAAKSVGKGMNVEKMKQFLLDLYYKHWEEKVSITCSMIIGLPGEDEEHVRSAFNWFRTEGKDLCDSWWPLTISTEGHYLSQFDKEHKKFQYDLSQGEPWVSPIMKYSDAYRLSQEFNSIGMNHDNHPGSWMIMALRGYGYSQEELMNWQVKDMPWKALLKKRIRMFQEYKTSLNSFLIQSANAECDRGPPCISLA
jgi:hypothetical protein